MQRALGRHDGWIRRRRGRHQAPGLAGEPVAPADGSEQRLGERLLPKRVIQDAVSRSAPRRSDRRKHRLRQLPHDPLRFVPERRRNGKEIGLRAPISVGHFDEEKNRLRLVDPE
jgi:hypothetical protein